MATQAQRDELAQYEREQELAEWEAGQGEQGQADQPAEQGFMDTALGYQQNMMEGLTAGHADEFNAAFQTPLLMAGQAMSGEPVDSVTDTYMKKKAMLSGVRNRTRQESPVMAATANIVGSIAPFSKMMAGLNTAVQAGKAGAAYAGANYIGELEDKADLDLQEGAIAMAEGGVGGALGTGVVNALGKVVAPKMSKAADYLKSKGIPTTIGEKLGGVYKTSEEKLMSVPALGDMIGIAKRRGMENYNLSVVNDALDPINLKLPNGTVAGGDSILWANKAISDGYSRVLGNMPVVKDAAFDSEMAGLIEMAAKLPPTEHKMFLSIIDDKLMSRFSSNNNLLLGETFKETDRGLREMYKRLGKNSNPYQSMLSDAVKQAHGSLMSLGRRQHPELSQELSAFDMAFAKMRTVDDAASMLGATDRVFSPSQMLSAIKRNTDKKRFSQQTGFNQRNTELAKEGMSSSIPDSGTAGRAAMGIAATGQFISPATAMLTAGMMAPYTKVGSNIVENWFSRGPNQSMVRELIEGMASSGAAMGANTMDSTNASERVIPAVNNYLDSE